MKKLIFSIVLLALASPLGKGILAQNMNEDFRKTAPAPLAPIPFNIAKPSVTKLPNGLRLVIFEDNRLPLVSFRLAFRSGDVNDPPGNTGLTSAMTSMLAEGTKTRKSKEIADAIEQIGASISASSTPDNTVIAASALAIYGSEVLGLLADIALTPTFPEDELRIYKQNAIENLKFQRSQPGFLSDEQISRVLYGSHPYSKTGPSAGEIEKITSQVLSDFHRKMFVPGNATLIVVGSINHERLLKEVRQHFEEWPAGDLDPVDFPAPPTRTEATLTIVDRPGSAQSNIVLSNLAIDRSDPDYFPVLVMNQVLGGGASARLFMNLREEKGYTYGAYSRIDARRQAGSFEATAEVRTPVTGDSLKEFFDEFETIRAARVPDQELKDAQNFLTGVFPIRAETQEGLTNLITSQQLYSLPEDYLQSYRDKINAVTSEDIARAAKKYVTPDKIAIVIVGDAEEILPQAKPYAKKVEIFDTDGNPRDIGEYGRENAAAGADVSGKWDLEIEAQGQKLPVGLVLTQTGSEVSGELSSMLGPGLISGGKVIGNRLSAVAKASIQGQDAALNISGTVDGDKMSGTIDTGFPGFPPLPFEGKRVEGRKAPSVPSETGAKPARNISGSWKIETNAAGQPVTFDLVFEQEGDKLSGTMTSHLGTGRVSEGFVSGDEVDASVILDFQGQPLTLKIKGKLESDTAMKGILNTQMPAMGDLPFTGSKQ